MAFGEISESSGSGEVSEGLESPEESEDSIENEDNPENEDDPEETEDSEDPEETDDPEETESTDDPDGSDNPDELNDPETTDDPDKPDESDLDEDKNVENENPENAQETEKDSESKSLRDKLKEKFDGLFGKKEAAENDSNDVDEKPEEQAPEKKDGSSFRDSLKADVSMRDQAKAAKEYREAHNLDEHGNKLDNSANDSSSDEDPESKTHGEDGERTRWSDAEYARNHER